MTRQQRVRGTVAALFAACMAVGASAVAMRTYAQAAQPQETATPQPDEARPAPNVPASEAVPVQQVPSPAAPTHAPDQVIWALIAAYAFQYIKKANWFPFITNGSSDRLKAQFGFAVATLTAAGVHFAITGDVLDGGGATLTISGLSLDVLKDVAFQWASQQAWFDLVVHRRVPDTHAPVADNTALRP